MRLLPKNEIQNLRNSERNIEVQEGLKLARKIDVLRETAAEEESRLAKFRTESLKATREAIDALIRQKQLLENDIAELKKEKGRLQMLLREIKDY